MSIPLLVDDARAAIIQLQMILEALRAAKRKKEEFEELDLPDAPPAPILDGMPPWAFSGPSPQSADRNFGSSPGGLTDNKGIENALKQAKRDEGKALKNLRERKARDPEGWADWIKQLTLQAQSKDLKVKFNARALLARLRQWGLI